MNGPGAGGVSAARRGSCHWLKVAKYALCSAHTTGCSPCAHSQPAFSPDVTPREPDTTAKPTYRERSRNTPPEGLQGSGTRYHVLCFRTVSGRRPALSTIRVHRHEPDPNGGE